MGARLCLSPAGIISLQALRRQENHRRAGVPLSGISLAALTLLEDEHLKNIYPVMTPAAADWLRNGNLRFCGWQRAQSRSRRLRDAACFGRVPPPDKGAITGG